MQKENTLTVPKQANEVLLRTEIFEIRIIRLKPLNLKQSLKSESILEIVKSLTVLALVLIAI